MVTINFTKEELDFILQVLGELPTRTNAFVLFQNIQKQVSESSNVNATTKEDSKSE